MGEAVSDPMVDEPPKRRKLVNAGAMAAVVSCPNFNTVQGEGKAKKKNLEQ